MDRRRQIITRGLAVQALIDKIVATVGDQIEHVLCLNIAQIGIIEQNPRAHALHIIGPARAKRTADSA